LLASLLRVNETKNSHKEEEEEEAVLKKATGSRAW